MTSKQALFTLILLITYIIPQRIGQAAASVPPIVFVTSKAFSPSTIYTVNADGSNLNTVGNGDFQMRSADGRFGASDNRGTVSFFSFDHTVSRTFKSLYPNAAMGWSPDSKHFAIVLDSATDNLHGVYLADEDGVNLQQLMTTESPSISWSADSQYLAVVVGGDIYKRNIEGPPKLTRVTNNGAAADNIQWSPDGKHIAFFIPERGNNFVYIVDSDGKNQHKIALTLGPDLYPRQYEWSPDGRYLILSDYRNVGNANVVDSTNWRLVSLGVDKGKCNQAKPSPDGKHLLCRSSVQLSNLAYSIVTISTGESRELEITPLPSAIMDWSPDGKQIAVGGEDWLHRGVGIVVLDADGSNPRLLDSTTGLGDIVDLMWSSTYSTTYDIPH